MTHITYLNMHIHHIAITVNNLEESVIFYTQVLKFEIARSFTREDMKGCAAFIKLHNFQIELWQFQDMKENSDSLNDIKIKGIRHVAFEVDNLNQTIFQLQKKGLEFSEPKLGATGHNYSFTNDPNGVVLEFYEK